MLRPGPRIPVALQTIEWMARTTAFLRRCAKRHGDLFTVHISTLGTPMVLASDPDSRYSLLLAAGRDSSGWVDLLEEGRT